MTAHHVTNHRPKPAQSRTQRKPWRATPTYPPRFRASPTEISPIPFPISSSLLNLPAAAAARAPSMASSSENAGAPTEEPQVPPPPQNPTEEAPGEEAEDPQTLERAQELFDLGSKAIEDGDFVEAVDFLSRALEIRLGSSPFPNHRFPSTHLVRARMLVEASDCSGRNWDYYCTLRYGSAEIVVRAKLLFWIRLFCESVH